MNTVLNLVTPLAHRAVEIALNGVWQGVLLTVVVWCLMRTFKHTDATTRFVLWWVTLIAVLWLPWMPSALQMPWPDPAVQPQNVAAPVFDLPEVVVRAPRLTPVSGPRPTAGPSPIAPPQPPAFSIPGGPWTSVAFGGWLILAGVGVLRVLIGYRHLQHLKARSAPMAPAYQARLKRWVATIGQGRKVSLCSCPDLHVPVAVGFFDPVILIPQTLAEQLSEAEFDQVGLHELAHLRRWDDWTNLAQRLVEAIFFFHPAVLWIGRTLQSEREIACDDWVVAVTGQARPYAACLTRLVELLATAPEPAPGSLTIARQISRRVALLLDKRRIAAPHLSKRSLATVLGAIAVIAVGAQFAPVIALPEEMPEDEPVTTQEQPDSLSKVRVSTPKALQLHPVQNIKPVATPPQPGPVAIRPVTTTLPTAPAPATQRPKAARPGGATPDSVSQDQLEPLDPAQAHRRSLSRTVPPGFDADQFEREINGQTAELERQIAESVRIRTTAIEKRIAQALRGKEERLDLAQDLRADMHKLGADLRTQGAEFTRSMLAGHNRKPLVSESERLSLLTDLAKTDSNSEVRTEAVRSIARIDSDASVQALIDLYNSSQDSGLRRRILRTLTRSERPQAGQKLIDIARNDSDPKLRTAAIRALDRADNHFDLDLTMPNVTIRVPTAPKPPAAPTEPLPPSVPTPF